MGLPFTQQQFLEVFVRYNRAIFPAQFLAAFLCLGLIAASLTRKGPRGKIVMYFLAGLWAWNGILYHMAFFSVINPIARVFGVLFVLQGILFVWAGSRSHSYFHGFEGWRSKVGLAMVLYAAAVYPILGWLGGHGYPYAPVLGVAPCPTTIFTLGLLLMAKPPVPRRLFAIPFLWSLLGASAAVNLGMWEDLGLVASAMVAAAIIVFAPQSRPASASKSGLPRSAAVKGS